MIMEIVTIKKVCLILLWSFVIGCGYKATNNPIEETNTDADTGTSSSQWTAVGTDIYYNLGSVGIGTSAPTGILHLHNGSGGLTETHWTSSTTGTSSNDGLQVGINNALGNAYIFNNEATPLTFSTSAVERMRIDASGNVGIGTTSPTAPLTVIKDDGVSAGEHKMGLFRRFQAGGVTSAGFEFSYIADGTNINYNRLWVDGEDGELRFSNYDTGQGIVDRMTIAGNGNVGIGTTSPDVKLEVSRTAGSAPDIYLTAYGINATSIPAFVGRAARGSEGAETAVQTGDRLASFRATAHDGTAWSSGTSAIEINSAQNWTTSAHGSYMKFETTSNGSLTRTERMRIDHNGNVGIGLTPSYQFQLSTDSAAKPGTATWTVPSDRRLKDIRAPFTRGLAALEELNPIYYNYKKNNALKLPSDKEYVGIIAQDVQKVIPESVQEDKQGFLSVTTDAIIWTLLNAIKELYHKVIEQFASVNRELDLLKAENQKLKNENNEIKNYLCAKDSKAPFCSFSQK